MTEREEKIKRALDDPSKDLFDIMVWMCNDAWDQIFSDRFVRYGNEHAYFVQCFFTGAASMIVGIGLTPDAEYQRKDSEMLNRLLDGNWNDPLFGGDV